MRIERTPRGVIFHISFRLRVMVIFTLLYSILFVILFIMLTNTGPRIVMETVQNVQGGVQGPALSDQTLQLIRDTVRSKMIAYSVPIYLGIYVVMILLLRFITYGVGRPMRVLRRYAEQVAKGDYTPMKIPLPLLSFTRDEITLFGDVFTQMVEKVRERESALQQQVMDLQIVIDEVKREKQVKEIVDTEFFVDLKDKAAQLRTRNVKKPASEVPSEPTSAMPDSTDKPSAQ